MGPFAYRDRQEAGSRKGLLDLVAPEMAQTAVIVGADVACLVFIGEIKPEA
jgi:hypothetical protein